MSIRHKLALGLAVLATGMGTSAAFAEYPERPITFIVPYGAGGGNDIGTRTWVPYLEQCLGNGATVVVVNKPGAGGEVGFTELANSAPDGYTLGSTATPNMPLGEITREKPTYSVDSFSYVGNLYGSSSTLNVLKGGKFASLDAVIAEGKTRPLTWGMSGFGSDDHLMGLRLMELAGIKLTFIPLGDAASVRNAILGGHVDLGGLSLAEAAPFQEQLSTLAVAADQQSTVLPGVPTFTEQGIDLIGGSLPIVAAPKGLPEDIKAKLSACFVSIAQDPKFQADAEQRKLLLIPMDAAQTEAYVRSEAATLKTLWETNPW